MSALFDGVPTTGPVTATFGQTDYWHPTPHTGVDLGPSAGTPISARCAGQVYFVSAAGGPYWWYPTFGNSVILLHEGHVSLYAHMATTPYVAVGQHIHHGDQLGIVGTTGQSSGPHLHWGLAPASNRWFDPAGPGGLLDALLYVAEPPPVPVPVVTEPEPPFRHLFLGYDADTWTHSWEIRINRKQPGQYQSLAPPQADGDEEVWVFKLQDWADEQTAAMMRSRTDMTEDREARERIRDRVDVLRIAAGRERLREDEEPTEEEVAEAEAEEPEEPPRTAV